MLLGRESAPEHFEIPAFEMGVSDKKSTHARGVVLENGSCRGGLGRGTLKRQDQSKGGQDDGCAHISSLVLRSAIAFTYVADYRPGSDLSVP